MGKSEISEEFVENVHYIAPIVREARYLCIDNGFKLEVLHEETIKSVANHFGIY